jgi:hypothetical protein
MDSSSIESELLAIMKECGGMEAHYDDWPFVENLIKQGKARWVTAARGPDKAFRRAEATND